MSGLSEMVKEAGREGPFDPMKDAPATDEEAEIFLKYGKDPGLGASLWGLYLIKREQGRSILGATAYVLELYLEPTNKP
jgi:hypothetical protein